HVGHERHSRHHRGRRDPGHRPGQHDDGEMARLPRRRARGDQRHGRIPGDRPHAPDVRRKEAGSAARMTPALAQLAYLVAAVLFILGIKQLSSPKSARSGNRLAAVGMTIALIVTLLDRRILSYTEIAIGLAIGGTIGAVAARRVAMTAMPQLVALLN